MTASRLRARLDAVRAAGRKALIPYLTAGDPRPDCTVALMHALVDAGADAIELGVPFSDPMADGPVIQAACERALAAGTSLRRVLELVAAFRAQDADTPVVLMGYLNPVEAMGYRRFAEAAARSGVDGVLLVDLTAEEADPVLPLLADAGLQTVFLVAPTTAPERIAAICERASGFVYYVARKGVTGSGAPDLSALRGHVAAIRRCTDAPVAVGFGVSDADTARAVGALADGVVVGSALVAEIAGQPEAPVEALARAVAGRLAPMREALDRIPSREHSGRSGA